MRHSPWLCVFFLCLATTASAQSVVANSGGSSVGPNPSPFVISGPGFTYNEDVAQRSVNYELAVVCNVGCDAGTVASLRLQNISIAHGTLTYQGQSYPTGAPAIPGQATGTVDVRFTGSVLLPANTGQLSEVTLMAAVTLKGTFQVPGGSSQALTGKGVSRVRFKSVTDPQNQSRRLWQFMASEYDIIDPVIAPPRTVTAFPAKITDACTAVDINAQGIALVNCVLTGTSTFSSAFLWADGDITKITTTAGTTRCTAINDNAQVLCDGPTSPYLWQNGTVTPLPELRNGRGLNDIGEVFGTTPSGQSGLRRTNGTVVTVAPGTFIFAFVPATALNNLSQVPARPQTSPLFDKVGVWTPTAGFVPLGDGWDFVSGINDATQMTSQLNGSAMLFTPGQGWHALPFAPLLPAGPSAEASAVNNLSQSVGSFFTSSPAPAFQHGAFWPTQETVLDLGTYSGLRTATRQLNTSGQIVGTAFDASSRQIALLWTVSGPGNSAPVVNATTPSGGGPFVAGTSIVLAASVFDKEEGDLSSNVTWTSSTQAGTIGTGAAINYQLLQPGVNVFTATVTDSNGSTATGSVTVTVTPAAPSPGQGVNVALASAGAVASASSFYSTDYRPAFVNDGNRAGPAFWNDATFGATPDFLQIDFAGPFSIGEVNVFSVQDNYSHPSTPTLTQLFSYYGVTDFSVQYWTGSAWATIPGATVVANSQVWRAITFTPITTQRIRVVITGAADGYSRLVEVEALTADAGGPAPEPPLPPTGINVASAANGGVVVASSSYSTDFRPTFVNDGNRAGPAFWNDATFNAFPDIVEIDFAGKYSVGQVNVFSVQDNYAQPSQPTLTQLFSYYGITDFQVQYWTGSAWVAIATVHGNSQVWRPVTFTPVTTDRIRLFITGTADGYSRLTEVEVLTADPGTPPIPPQPAAGINVAGTSNGGVATASSFYSTDYRPAFVNDGNRAGPAFWNDATAGVTPDFVQIDFAGTYSIGQVNVFSVQDNYANPSPPTTTQQFSLYGVRDFALQYWTGSDWAPIPGASVTGNSLVWRTVTFTPVTTQRIRIVITRTPDGYSRLTEVEALTAGS